ncbi:hypothetical protein ACQJBY_047624 [Aegilops geniculata]
MEDGIRTRDYEGMLRRRLNGAEEPKDMPLALLQMITNEFSEENKIGQGGFGVVYKGELGDVIVAVKRIYVNLDKLDNDDKLFDREFNSLRKTNHPNVVRFLGFCSNTSKIPIEMNGSGETILANWRERLLCFEFISSGSLDKHITDELRGLKWETRYDIITGICKGLCYLHEQKKIIHMDLKPANILLDDLMVPKITDFGLSRPNKNSHTKAQPIGTRGYIAPEYMEGSKTTPACDIYSLGVIIVELVTGCMEVPDENNILRRWRHRWRKPPTLLQYQQVTRCIDIARCCREQKPEDRPSIKKIIDSLSESTDGHASQISPHFDEDDMLRINPLELRLPSELKNKISRSVELSNGTRNCTIAFNIQLPSKQYIAQPDKGIVRPESKYRVNITVQAQDVEGRDHADKFIVQSMQVEASEGLRDDNITERMFEKTGKFVDKVDLMVVYEPTKPPENCKHRQDTNTNTPTEEVPEDIGSSSYNNTIYSSKRPQGFNLQSPESISRNLTTSLTSDQTMDLATGAIGSLLPKLSQLLNEFSLEKSIRSDVDYVIQELRVMRIDLCNVSEVQRDNSNEHIKLVKLWADEVRELSYDIEDVVDGFLMHVAGSEPATSTEGLMGLIQKLMSCMMGLIQKMIDGSHTEDDDWYQIGGAIRNFKNQVQNKSVSKEKYKVEKVVVKTISTINAHHLSALAKSSNRLVGINDAMKDFTKRLTGADVKVHSIFGSGGLGKTTLARAVYNQLKGSFSLTAFVPVGRNPDMKKLLYDILFELDERRYINLKAGNLDERQLINVLTKLLENNRYLIVIDDMWEKKVWHDLIKFAFLDGKRGSKIVITTRIFEVATIATDVYKLHPLTHDYSEELFYATLSPEEGRCENKVTDEVIKKILQKCGGVPLAIITIACLLASKL